VCIGCTIKCLILLMPDATVKLIEVYTVDYFKAYNIYIQN